MTRSRSSSTSKRSTTARAEAVDFADLEATPAAAGGARHNLDLFLDVTIPVSVEIGRAQVTLEEVLDLVPGSVVPLDKRADEPVDLWVNGKLVARGEVVMVDDHYGLRVTQVVASPSAATEG